MGEWRVRPYPAEDEARVVSVCVAAFEPIHRGFEAALGPALFALEYSDWRGGYARQIAAVAEAAPALEMHVVEEAGRIVGFVQTVLHETGLGEIGLNAVDPVAQGRGSGGSSTASRSGGCGSGALARPRSAPAATRRMRRRGRPTARRASTGRSRRCTSTARSGGQTMSSRAPSTRSATVRVPKRRSGVRA
jgi:hypothetical protein